MLPIYKELLGDNTGEQNMNVPPFYNFKFVDESGNLTSEAQLFMASINQAMLGALTNDGWTVPNLATTQILPSDPPGITQVEPKMPVGTIWFNTTLLKLQVKTAAGVVETITST